MLLSCDEGDTGAKHIVDEADKVLARLSLTTLFTFGSVANAVGQQKWRSLTVTLDGSWL